MIRLLKLCPVIAVVVIGILFLLFPLISTSQTSNYPTGARQAAMGMTSTALSDIWSVFNNPATLARQEKSGVALNYENKFLLKELGQGSLAGLLPTKAGVFGLGIKQFGGQLYSETFAGIGYGRSFGHNFSAGVRLDAYHVRLDGDYGSRTLPSFALGVSTNLTSDLILAAVVFNPVRVPYAIENSETLPAIIRCGVAYAVDKNLTMTLDAEKDSRHKPAIRGGLEYQLLNVAVVRAGMGTSPTSFSFGFGLLLGSMRIDISATRHEVLGFSPVMGISWQSN